MSGDKSCPLGCWCEIKDRRHVDHNVRAKICPTSDSRAGRRASDSHQELYECEKYAFFSGECFLLSITLPLRFLMGFYEAVGNEHQLSAKRNV